MQKASMHARNEVTVLVPRVLGKVALVTVQDFVESHTDRSA